MNVMYNLKQLIPIATLATAALMLTSCDKNDDEDNIPEATKDIELKFTNYNGFQVLDFDTLRKYANDKTVRTIYLVPTEHWNTSVAGNITFLRNNSLQPRLNISPKIRGRGDFDFVLGEASKVPDDSLWFVKNGWTINKQYQK